MPFKELIKKLKLMIAVALLSMVVIMFCLFMSYKIRNLFEKSVEFQVKESAVSIAELFSEKINSEFEELKRIVSMTESNGSIINDQTFKFMNEDDDIEVGIFRIKDNLYLPPEILNSFRGWDSIGYSKLHGLTFSVPVYSGNNVSSVLYRKYSVSKLNEIFSVRCQGDNGIACVIKSDGETVIPFKNQNSPLIEVYNSEAINKAFVSIRDKMVVSSSAVEHFKYLKKGYYLFESEINDSDFRILGLIEEDFVFKGFESIQGVLLWVFGMLFVFIVAGTFMVMDTEEKSKLAASEKNAALAQSEAKGSFLASMSHEIRTPLNAILGMNDIVIRETKERNIKEYAEQIKRSSETLLSIINDVLDFSKIESGKMEIRNASYHLLGLINDISMMMTEKVKQKNLTFKTEIDYDLPDELLGDEIRVKQILINLLNNAIKYTEYGSVQLRIFGEREYDEIYLHIVVHDTGIGIEKESIPFLFNSFSRADEERNKYIEGTGLGLAIVKQLIDLMDGKISVRSVYGVGSEFEAVIPQKVLSSKNMKESTSLKLDYSDNDRLFIAPDAHVAVVDDNEVNLLVAEKLLATMKVQTHCFKDPVVALGFLKTQKVDIMLLDDIMPSMNGVDLLKNVKVPESANEHTAAVALTANAMAGSREKYLKSGFDSYISKPVSLQVLRSAIRDLLPQRFIQEVSSESSVQEEVLDAAAKHVDESLGLSYCAGSRDIYKTIISKYVDVAPSKKQRICDALETKDWNDLMIEIHALKSSSMSIGARKLSDDAKQMELVLKDIVNELNVENNISYVENNIETLIGLYDNVVTEASRI
ncbi:MAG: response regulator [Treponema sp.]|nr:response regulator [Treponema sp.]